MTSSSDFQAPPAIHLTQALHRSIAQLTNYGTVMQYDDLIHYNYCIFFVLGGVDGLTHVSDLGFPAGDLSES